MKGKKGQSGKYAKGGKVVEMNGQGSATMVEGKKTSGSGFKTGGVVGGKAAMPRLDKRARGGRMGGSPMSSAAAQKDRMSGNPGHEAKP